MPKKKNANDGFAILKDFIMKEEYFKWYSPNLNREVEMLVFGHAGYPVILFPTSMGSYQENKDQKLIESAAVQDYFSRSIRLI